MLFRFFFILLSLNFLACSFGGNGKKESTKAVIRDTISEVERPKEGLPLSECVKIYSPHLKDEVTAKKLCSCFVSYASSRFQEEVILRFMEENWEALNDEQLFALTDLYESCFTSGFTKDSTKFEGYSPEIIAILKESILLGLKQAGFQQAYDLDILSSCLVEGIQRNFTVGEVISGEVMETELFQKLQDVCALKAKL